MEIVDDGLVGQVRSLHLNDKLLRNFILDVRKNRVANLLIEPVHGGLIPDEGCWLDWTTFLSADNPPGPHFIHPPLRLLLKSGSGRSGLDERFRRVHLRLSDVIS